MSCPINNSPKRERERDRKREKRKRMERIRIQSSEFLQGKCSQGISSVCFIVSLIIGQSSKQEQTLKSELFMGLWFF